jgi:hypothetical protein
VQSWSAEAVGNDDSENYAAVANPRGAASRRWRVSLIRKRAQVLGYVDAPSREVAEAAAANAFSLTDDQRKRLVAQKRG